MDNIKKTDVFIYPDAQSLFNACAKDFASCAARAIAEKNNFTVVLSGGNTPKQFYSILVEQYVKRIEWNKIYFFFGDERYVPMDNQENNYHMTETSLFSKLPVNREQIFRINTDFPTAEQSARAYQNTLREVMQLKPHAFPVFDLVYLGLGDDAHTASLFPESDLVRAYAQQNNSDEDTLVAGYYVKKINMDRITLTPPAINHGKNIHFIIEGENKAHAVQAVLQGNYQPELYPAQLIKSLTGTTSWYLDNAAAKNIS